MSKLFAILTGCLILFSYGTSGQVQSESYDQLLGTLLKHSVNEISVSQAKALNDTVVFLDAREKREFEISHIKDARFVGYDHFNIETVRDLPKGQKIVVYCSVGYRSEKIAEKLVAAGYSEVSNLYGGIFEWKNQELKVYNGQGATEAVHAYDKVWGIWLTKGKKVYK